MRKRPGASLISANGALNEAGVDWGTSFINGLVPSLEGFDPHLATYDGRGAATPPLLSSGALTTDELLPPVFKSAGPIS
jgi:hypothetical protein